jgi:hypothetical protein
MAGTEAESCKLNKANKREVACFILKERIINYMYVRARMTSGSVPSVFSFWALKYKTRNKQLFVFLALKYTPFQKHFTKS